MLLTAFKKLSENTGLFLANSNFYKRLLSAIALAGVTVYTMYSNNLATSIMLIFIYFGCLIEWFNIMLVSRKSKTNKLIWTLGTITFITFGAFFLIEMSLMNSRRLLLLCIVIWLTDIGAYVIGNLIKGPKLIPKISPNKTWSGAIGGFCIGAITGVTLIDHFPRYKYLIAPFQDQTKNILFLISIILVSQIGDLIESYAKRCFNIRDSSQILPGHGGILDRCDSMIAVGVYLHGLCYIY